MIVRNMGRLSDLAPPKATFNWATVSIFLKDTIDNLAVDGYILFYSWALRVHRSSSGFAGALVLVSRAL